jgi:hypothetical protein
MKTVSTGRFALFGCALALLVSLSAHAQTAPDKGIGSAPEHSRQHQILTHALSPETRSTLQEAMDSFSVSASSHGK